MSKQAIRAAGAIAEVMGFWRETMRGGPDKITEKTITAWTHSLGEFSPEAILRAGEAVAQNQDWWPSLHEMLEESQTQARALAMNERDRNGLPEPEPDMEQGAANIRRIAAMLRGQTADAPDHDHRKGIEECRACAQKLDHQASVEAEHGMCPTGPECRICQWGTPTKDHSFVGADRISGDELTVCRAGCTEGWAVVEERGHATVEPCSVCNTITYDRWTAGHYNRDHHCPECEDIRRQRQRASA